MTNRDTLPVDLQHEFCEPIGYVDQFAVTDEGLVLDGYLVAIVGNEDDKGMEVIPAWPGRYSESGVDRLRPRFMRTRVCARGFNLRPTANLQWTTDDHSPVGAARRGHLFAAWDAGTEARFSKDAKDAPHVSSLNWKDKGKFAMTTTTQQHGREASDTPSQPSRSTMCVASSQRLVKSSSACSVPSTVTSTWQPQAIRGSSRRAHRQTVEASHRRASSCRCG